MNNSDHIDRLIREINDTELRLSEAICCRKTAEKNKLPSLKADADNNIEFLKKRITELKLQLAGEYNEQNDRETNRKILEIIMKQS